MTLGQTGFTKVTELVNTLAIKFEQKSHKITSWNSTINNTNYPSEKLIKDSINELENKKLNKYIIGFSNSTATSPQITTNNDTVVTIKKGTGLRVYLMDLLGNNIINTDEINNINTIEVLFILNGALYMRELTKANGYSNMNINFNAGTTQLAQICVYIDNVFAVSGFCKYTMVDNY